MSKLGKTSMSGTLVAGSEEDFDVICDLCNNDGQRVQATGHCIDCNENMCISCMKFHRKLPAVKDHVMKDKSTLSQSQKARRMVNKPAVDKDPMTDRCPKHTDELIKFYCNPHSALACSDCISLDHRSCEDILYIKDVSGDIADTDELNKIQADLHMLVARLTGTQSRAKWIKQTINDSYSQTVSDIRKLKKEIIEMLNQLEKELLERSSLIMAEKVNALDGTLSACENMIGQTEELIADIEKKKAMNHNYQLFISMKHAQSRLPDIADEADQLCIRSKYDRFSFRADEQLTNLLSTLTGLGEMILVSHFEDVRPEYQHDIYVKSDTDTDNCIISGTIVLPDGRLALSDVRSVKLVDITKRKVSDEIKLDQAPIDLTRIANDTIAVTIEHQRYIQVLSVSPALSKSYTIAVSCLYYVIEYIPDKLILVCRDPKSAVHVCDMSGVVLQQIETDFNGNKLFTQASRIAISPDHGMMYVSDPHEHTVVCLTMDGKLINKCTSDSLKCPVGIAADDGGCVYVCSQDTHSVHQLSPIGKLVKLLLKENDGMVFPYAIAYGAGHLIINSNSTEPDYKNNVKVYRLAT